MTDAMSFPAALFATIGLLAVGVVAVSALGAAVRWCFALVTMRIRAPRWMGISDWAGPIFMLFAMALAALAIGLFA